MESLEVWKYYALKGSFNYLKKVVFFNREQIRTMNQVGVE
jgi:hypothetical protein